MNSGLRFIKIFWSKNIGPSRSDVSHTSINSSDGSNRIYVTSNELITIELIDQRVLTTEHLAKVMERMLTTLAKNSIETMTSSSRGSVSSYYFKRFTL